ncbi:MAG: alkaline phosphatase family protein [Nitrososphaeria archaeon]
MIGIFVYVDALPYIQVSDKLMPFLSELFKKSKTYMLQNIMGYSFGIQSTILSGKLPSETMHWMPYVYRLSNDAFKRCISSLARKIDIDITLPHPLKIARYGFNSRFIMRKGAKIGSMPLKFIDRFHVYPYYYINELPYFKSLKEDLNNKFGTEVRYFGPPQNKEPVGQAIQYVKGLNGVINNNVLLFVYLDMLDGIGHSKGVNSKEWNLALTYVDRNIEIMYTYVKKKFNNFAFMIFSDHGMCNVKDTFDVMRCLRMTGLDRDQATFFVDATLTMIWLNEYEDSMEVKLKETIKRLFGYKVVVLGRKTDKNLLQKCGIYREDRAYGDIIIQTCPGFMFFPNFYSDIKPFIGVHGFLPHEEHQQSFLVFAPCGNELDHPTIYNLTDIRFLLEQVFSN